MTSKDYLSQEEIDALLRQSAGEMESSEKTAETEEFKPENYISSIESDALGEIGNITFGSAATALSTLLGKKVDITTPKVSVIRREDLEREFPKPHVAVHVHYVEGFQGINSLVIKTKDAQVIADLMLGGEGEIQDESLNEIHVSAVQEAMNQMMGSSATSMSTIFNRFVNISPPGINILDVNSGEGVGNLPPVDVFIKISFDLRIGELIDSTIMQLLPVAFAKEMVATLIGGAGESEPVSQEAAVFEEPERSYAPPAAAYQEPPVPSFVSPQEQLFAAPAPAQHAQGPNTYGAMPGRNVNVQPVQFSGFQSASYTQADDTNLNLLLDIPLKVTVELGRTKKQIKEILELSQGSIIELDKLAGEPVDILVNNKLIAKGEVVVIDENFGVRVTDIVSQWDRIQKLQ
ncbi:flagellar motor switch phosphatase FliY [Paenibacillus sp. GCM10012307]|uniref:Flagellar motor switch phosphatase FliY n=1 Tax=Paenibacillus roseus TaxID=2798579 RepID=A0A934MWQ4_9BACL|nr:flagellar motor switch phosphatase FliY [Paenibacillus roseus]MBJ6363387.1 flagellar motor switch phosphatase FliY [Paenibacillus roseus]